MKVEKTLVGWVVILIILWILFHQVWSGPYTGFGEALILSLSSVVQLFILSIVCTLGISLIVWIPLGLGVGHIVFAIFGWGDRKPQIKPAEDDQQPESQSAASLTRDQQALLNYIKKAREKGLPNHQIRQNLTNNGWAIDSIAGAFQMARNG